MRSMASDVISFHGWGGYMNEAFWICSLMSSSSLNGNVPERLTYKMTTVVVYSVSLFEVF